MALKDFPREFAGIDATDEKLITEPNSGNFVFFQCMVNI